MSTRLQRDNKKEAQIRYQGILSTLLKDEDNKYCVDCDAKGPRWASWNLGIFLCIRCAGIHRNLGVHISKVKSVNLDSWTYEQISILEQMGNSRARAVYEANLPDNYRRPQTDSSLETFIRAKYEHKKYIAKEWIPPSPHSESTIIEKEKKSEEKTQRPRPNSGVPLQKISSVKDAKKSETKPVQSKQTTVTADLLSLDTPAAVTSSPSFPDFGSSAESAQNITSAPSNSLQQQQQQQMVNKPQGSDLTSQPSVQSSAPSSTAAAAESTLESLTFPDPTESKPKTAKDSIMALFGNQSSPQAYCMPGGVYMPQNQMPMNMMSNGFLPTATHNGTNMMVNHQQQALNMQQQQQTGIQNINMQQQSAMQPSNLMQASVQQGNMHMMPNMASMPQQHMHQPQMNPTMSNLPGVIPQQNSYANSAAVSQLQNCYQPVAQPAMYQPPVYNAHMTQMQNQMSMMSINSNNPTNNWVPNQIPQGQTLSNNLWQ